MRSRDTASTIPMIGIYWLQCKGGLFSIFHSIPYTIEFGMEYGNFIIAKEAHYETWLFLQKRGAIPKNAEYDDIPRGRVLYNKVQKRYKVFTGRWVIPVIKSVISANFRLPKRGVIWDTDEHYNTFKRLSLKELGGLSCLKII
jgi:hypothetical protein